MIWVAVLLLLAAAFAGLAISMFVLAVLTAWGVL